MDGPLGSRRIERVTVDANLAAERGHGPERDTVRRQYLIADKKTRLMSGRVLDDPSDDSASPIVARS